MELDYRDPKLDLTLRATTRNWNKLLIRDGRVPQVDQDKMTIMALALVGQDHLLISCDAQTPTEVRADYFPITVDIVDAASVRTQGWRTLAFRGDFNGFSARVQWLFDSPLLRPLEVDDDIEKNWGKPDAEMVHLCFYGGLEIASKDGTARLCCESSQVDELSMTIRLVGC